MEKEPLREEKYPSIQSDFMFMCLQHTWRLYNKAEISSKRRNLTKNLPALSTRLCSDDSWRSLGEARRLVNNNSCTHRNYMPLTASSFMCLLQLSVFIMNKADSSRPSSVFRAERLLGSLHRAFQSMKMRITEWRLIHERETPNLWMGFCVFKSIE